MNVPDDQHQAGLVFGAWLARSHSGSCRGGRVCAALLGAGERSAPGAGSADDLRPGRIRLSAYGPASRVLARAEQILLDTSTARCWGTVSAEEAVMGAAEEIQYLVEEYAD